MNRRLRAVILAIFIISSTFPCLINSAMATQTSFKEGSSFFSYLTDTKRPPLLIDYSPSDFDPRRGENFHLPSPTSIEKDLRALRQVFDGLIVYSFHPDVTPVILEKAKQLQFRAVVLGIWSARSRTEIQGVIRLIHEYADTIALAVCLGNEGLHFHRYTTNDLIKANEFIRTSLDPGLEIPITTSEPMRGYRNPALSTFGDFLAPNIHPVWEKPALPPKDAVFWTRTQAISLMEKAQKPVLVKETGFPHSGERHFTPEAQQKFWDMYLNEKRLLYSKASPHAWVSFATSFEAFSLPWKAEESGEPVEAGWGLMNRDRIPFPAFYTWSRARSSIRDERELSYQRVDVKQ
ncbi:exo-beta-1,3-glucanase [Candidatus Nitrospira salsa]